MKLYKLLATDSAAFWGNPMDRETTPVLRNATIVAQAPDCSSFLVLSTETESYLDPVFDLADYVFVYCQAWGLTINAEVVQRVWSDLRAKAYPPSADYLDAVVKGDAAQQQAYIDACLAVKTKYPK